MLTWKFILYLLLSANLAEKNIYSAWMILVSRFALLYSINRIRFYNYSRKPSGHPTIPIDHILLKCCDGPIERTRKKLHTFHRDRIIIYNTMVYHAVTHFGLQTHEEVPILIPGLTLACWQRGSAPSASSWHISLQCNYFWRRCSQCRYR